MKRFLHFSLVFALLFIPVAYQVVRGNAKTSLQQLKLSESDKNNIILSILNRGAFGESNLQVSWQSDRAYISTDNLPESFIKKFKRIKGIEIVFVSPEGLEKRARNNFDYLEFGEFELKKNKVLISLYYSYADTNTSSLSYEFRKIKGKWKGKLKDWSATAS